VGETGKGIRKGIKWPHPGKYQKTIVPWKNSLSERKKREAREKRMVLPNRKGGEMKGQMTEEQDV